MKKILLIEANEVEVKPFYLKNFNQETTDSIRSKRVTKKELKILAKKIGLEYSDKEIALIKKLMEAYMAKR